jgi:hypothetical protein
MEGRLGLQGAEDEVSHEQQHEAHHLAAKQTRRSDGSLFHHSSLGGGDLGPSNHLRKRSVIIGGRVVHSMALQVGELHAQLVLQIHEMFFVLSENKKASSRPPSTHSSNRVAHGGGRETERRSKTLTMQYRRRSRPPHPGRSFGSVLGGGQGFYP